MPGTNDSRTPSSSLRPSHVRSVALAAAVVGVVVLPIAAAQATPSHGTKQTSATGIPATGAPATASAQLPQFCGATGTGFQGQVTAQPCVDDSDGTVTAVVYVGNSSDKPLTVAINLTRADGSLAQMQCTVAAHTANGSCTTGALQDAAGKGSFNAIAEAVPVGAPLALGVLHVESGHVNPSAGGAANTTSASGSGSVGGGSGSASTSPSASVSPAA